MFPDSSEVTALGLALLGRFPFLDRLILAKLPTNVLNAASTWVPKLPNSLTELHVSGELQRNIHVVDISAALHGQS